MKEAHRQLAETMREDLLERLFNSELQATGYLESARPGRAPVFIDPTHFDNCIPNWKLSTIFADGREWSRVRISGRISREKTVTRGSGPAIRAAISQLLRDGLDLFAMPRKAAAQEVRKKLGVNSSAGNGLSDGNLAKYIFEACGRKAI